MTIVQISVVAFFGLCGASFYVYGFMIIISDLLRAPFDEGGKVSVLNLVKSFYREFSCGIVSLNSNTDIGLSTVKFQTNKLLIDFRLISHLRSFSDENIIYIPEASITLASFVRAFILRLFTGKKVTVYALQSRTYSTIQLFIIRVLYRGLIITPSVKAADHINRYKLRAEIVPLGVDEEKFREFSVSQKILSRKKYGISLGSKVVLHVGHIKASRNLEWLIELKKNSPTYEMVVVGSTYNSENDQFIYKALLDNDINVFCDYIPNLEEVYNLADVYAFPVLDDLGAIGTPLSVLEAMACNIPVVTTPFGSLPDSFIADDHFQFTATVEEFLRAFDLIQCTDCDNRSKLKPFNWDAIAKRIYGKVAPTFYVYISGIDGCGKTTQAKQLVQALTDAGVNAEYAWLRWEPSIRAVVQFLKSLRRGKPPVSGEQRHQEEDRTENDWVNFKKKLLDNSFFRRAWMSYASLDYYLGYLLGMRKIKSRVVVLDRYVHDFMIDQSVNLGKSPEECFSLANNFFIRKFRFPDLNIIIDLPPDVGYRRKMDGTSLGHLETRSHFYQALDDKNTIHLDGLADIETLASTIKEHVFKRLEESHG